MLKQQITEALIFSYPPDSVLIQYTPCEHHGQKAPGSTKHKQFTYTWSVICCMVTKTNLLTTESWLDEGSCFRFTSPPIVNIIIMSKNRLRTSLHLRQLHYTCSEIHTISPKIKDITVYNHGFWDNRDGHLRPLGWENNAKYYVDNKQSVRGESLGWEIPGHQWSLNAMLL